MGRQVANRDKVEWARVWDTGFSSWSVLMPASHGVPSTCSENQSQRREMREEDQEPDHAQGSILRQPGLKPPYVDIYVIHGR